MSGTTFYIAVLLCMITLGVLIIGVIGFGTGKASGSFSNKMMRYRIFFQFAAIIAILVTVWLAKGEG
ncbi:MAG: twin transmembrane helix small protein [Pseudomonadota bacterium]